MILHINYYIVTQIKYKVVQTPITDPMKTSRGLVSLHARRQKGLLGLLTNSKGLDI